MKPLQLDWFENESRDTPFDDAWLTDEYDEVMDVYDLNIIERWLY